MCTIEKGGKKHINKPVENRLWERSVTNKRGRPWRQMERRTVESGKERRKQVEGRCRMAKGVKFMRRRGE